jgi:hypothetical protein
MFVGLKRKETCGIKDLNTFNLSLLVKWRWRLLVDKEAQWIGVLRAKYIEVSGPTFGIGVWSKASIW